MFKIILIVGLNFKKLFIYLYVLIIRYFLELIIKFLLSCFINVFIKIVGL